MRTREEESAARRPAWADPLLDDVERDGHTHVDDRGVRYASASVDQWTPSDSRDPVKVYVGGFRHDSGRGADWPDEVCVDGDVNQGGINGVCLQVGDARRLAHALLAACDLAESRPGKVLC